MCEESVPSSPRIQHPACPGRSLEPSKTSQEVAPGYRPQTGAYLSTPLYLWGLKDVIEVRLFLLVTPSTDAAFPRSVARIRGQPCHCLETIRRLCLAFAFWRYWAHPK